jgi:hypothetical protein
MALPPAVRVGESYSSILPCNLVPPKNCLLGPNMAELTKVERIATEYGVTAALGCQPRSAVKFLTFKLCVARTLLSALPQS